MPDARTAILSAIRRQLSHSRQADSPDRARANGAIPRGYRQSGSLAPKERTALLVERLLDYDAEVLPVAETAIASAIAEVLARHGESVLLVPATLPQGWLPEGIEVLRDVELGLPLQSLIRAHAVLTPCAVAIAETGTIVLQHGPEQGRRSLSLLPDHHLCVLRRDQIVQTVSEGLALVNSANAAAFTTISGPSATADIEMTRIRGVHGPRRLTVLLVG